LNRQRLTGIFAPRKVLRLLFHRFDRVACFKGFG
jgi:hypothetical protein